MKFKHFFKETFHLITSLVGIFCSSQKNFFFHILVFSLTTLNGSLRYILTNKKDDCPFDYNKMTILAGTSMVVGYGAIACKNYIDGKPENIPQFVESGLNLLAVVTPSLSLLSTYNNYLSQNRELLPGAQDKGTMRDYNIDLKPSKLKIQ
jgi:hypothetical protein